MTRKKLVSYLRQIEACDSLIRWVRSLSCQTAEEVWNLCPRGYWLLWIAAMQDADRQKLVFTTCQCVRLVLPLVTEGETRPLQIIETLEAWTRDEANMEEIVKAADRIRGVYVIPTISATYAISAASYAAAAAHALYTDAAAYYASFAVQQVSNAVFYATDSTLFDAESARQETLAKCADIVRQHITFQEVMRAAL